MPTYGYRCESCGHEFEEYQSIKAEPIKVCPQCSKAKVRRLIGTGAALLFKGSGFYQTDYRSSSYSQAAKSDSAGSSSSTSGTTPAASPAPANGSSNGNGAAAKSSGAAGDAGGSK